jgi:hypothetical protein
LNYKSTSPLKDNASLVPINENAKKICQVAIETNTTFKIGVWEFSFSASCSKQTNKKRKYLMSSIQLASEKTVQKGRVAPQAILAPTNSEH